jgi:Fe-S-cluster containining protein
VTSICVGCGLCCDGSMYRTVEVDGADHLETLETSGLLLSTRDDVTAFRQPCTVFCAGRCNIYASRPAVCRDYRCLLLRRYESGEVGYEDAKALIAKTTALRDRVRPGLVELLAPESPQALEGLYRLATIKFDAYENPAAARAEHGELLLDVAALRVILAREFEPRDSKSHQAEPSSP